jgi:hypothetical protein
MPFRLKEPLRSAAGPLRTSVVGVPTEPSAAIGTRYRFGRAESVNQAAPPAMVTSLMNVAPVVGSASWRVATSSPVLAS